MSGPAVIDLGRPRRRSRAGALRAWFTAPAGRRDVRRAGWIGAAAALALTFVMTATYLTTGDGFGLINDFVVEAWPPLQTLHAGHLGAFLSSGPAYAGSLLLRSPFLLGAMALHGNWQTAYAAGAVPCVAAPALCSVWLGDHLLAGGTRLVRGWVYLSPLSLLLVINPVVVYALIYGHPEDLLGGVMVLAGVVCAARGGWISAGVLTGLAVDNKSWALVAVPVVLAVLERRRLPALVLLVLTVAVVNVPLLLLRGTSPGSLGGSTGTIFTFPQLWWWFGVHSWIAQHAHELLVIASAAAAGTWWACRRRRARDDRDRLREALWLLAFVLFIRAALDSWDNIYYQLPFLLAIYALEYGRAPRLSVALTIVLSAVTVPLHLYGLDVRAGAYQAVAVPLLLALAARNYAPERWRAVIARFG